MLQGRELERRFDEIGDKIASNLASLFQGSEIAEGEQTAIAVKVSSVSEEMTDEHRAARVHLGTALQRISE